jgi:hypothetical protein
MRVIDYLHRLDLRDLPWWERAPVRVLQFVQATWGQLNREKVLIRASGLAYSSLLAGAAGGGHLRHVLGLRRV